MIYEGVSPRWPNIGHTVVLHNVSKTCFTPHFNILLGILSDYMINTLVVHTPMSDIKP